MDISPFDAILGSNWIKSLGVIQWDFANLSMKFTLNNIPYHLQGITHLNVHISSAKDMASILPSARTVYLCQVHVTSHVSTPATSPPHMQLSDIPNPELAALLLQFQKVFTVPLGLPPPPIL